MASKDSSARFHPYESNRKPKIHRTSTSNNNNPHNYAKKRKTHSTIENSQRTGLSINDLKRRIRDVKRLLGHADLSPEARILQERALAGYEKDLKGEQERRQRSEMIKKYHFVRFLDRKTATKDLRSAQRRLENFKVQEGNSSDLSVKIAKLQAAVDIAQTNVNYAIYYPLTEKYISLYPQDKKQEITGSSQEKRRQQPRGDDNDDDGDENSKEISNNEKQDDDAPAPSSSTINQKPPMWHIVKKCMDENTLEQLRDGKLNFGPSAAGNDVVKGSTKEDTKEKERKKKQKDAIESKHKYQTKLELHEEEEEDSDGGFFE